MSKFTEFFDSFAFNATLSLVSLAALANHLSTMIAAGSFAPGGVNFVIWIVIAYHFITLAHKQHKEWRQRKAINE